MYRKGIKSARMTNGEEKSRRTNQNHPLRLVTGVKQEEGMYYPELECGHTAPEGYLNQDHMSWMIPAKKKKRCLACTPQ